MVTLKVKNHKGSIDKVNVLFSRVQGIDYKAEKINESCIAAYANARIEELSNRGDYGLSDYNEAYISLGNHYLY